jgi:hypothetical protein
MADSNHEIKVTFDKIVAIVREYPKGIKAADIAVNLKKDPKYEDLTRTSIDEYLRVLVNNGQLRKVGNIYKVV